jgi:hypothetical protein
MSAVLSAVRPRLAGCRENKVREYLPIDAKLHLSRSEMCRGRYAASQTKHWGSCMVPATVHRTLREARDYEQIRMELHTGSDRAT